MNGKGKHLVGTVILSALALLWGCVAPAKRDLTPPGSVADKTSSTSPAAEAPTTPQEPTALGAIAEFLERTKEYQAPVAELASAAGSRAASVESGTKPGKGPEKDAIAATPDGVDRLPPDQVFANTQVTLEEASRNAAPRPATPIVRSVSIRSTRPADVISGSPARASTTNQALDMAIDESPSVDKLVAILKGKAETATDFDTQWQLRMVQLAAQRDADAAAPSLSLSPDTQRILGALVPVISAGRAAARNPSMISEDAVARVDKLRRALTDGMDPVVSSVSLCRRVITFGVYDEMTGDDFVAGRTLNTIVYCEVSNLRSEPTDDGHHRAVLGTRIEVFTPTGQSVWLREEPEVLDVCRRPRTDFFLAQRVSLPAALPPGDYVLKVTVEDKLSGRANEGSHAIALTAPSSVAKK